jgi:hypothetical protein
MRTNRGKVWLAAAVAILALGRLASVAAEPGDRAAVASNSVARAFQELAEEAGREARLLPRLKDGKVSAVEPRSAALLQYIIDDYRSRRTEGLRSIHYCAVVGCTAPTNSASGVGQFRVAGMPSASYFISIGTEIAASEYAVVLTTFEYSDGARELKSTVYWESGQQGWKLLRSEGPGKVPMAVDAVK